MPRNARGAKRPPPLLYVSNEPGGGAGVVSEYNASTANLIAASLIAGLNSSSFGLAVSGNTLFVSDDNPNIANGGTVGAYDATTEAAINADFITGLNQPTGLALLVNTLFVADFNNGTVNGGTVGTYNATTGAVINANFITGLTVPVGIAVNGTVKKLSKK